MPDDPSYDHPETPAEEIVSAVTHGIGALLSLAATILMINSAGIAGGVRLVATVTTFGVSLVLLYVASACFHAVRHPRMKYWFNVLDHIAIYCLIAGTYTPFLLVSIQGGWGWSMFGVMWGIALFGIIFKLFFIHRFRLVSTLLYLAMGWVGIIAAKPFLTHVPANALWLLLCGGIAYTSGVVFYLWLRLPFNHAIWHLFVMAGSACQFLAVWLYVIPA